MTAAPDIKWVAPLAASLDPPAGALLLLVWALWALEV